MKFNIKRAVETLSKKDLKFIQPLYEAIANSIEANATEIVVDIHTEDVISEDVSPKVVGFSITDNGDGFTQSNIDSFLELWSIAKIDQGCKGSGRFTWLNVFENIEIESQVVADNRLVRIPFHINYEDEVEFDNISSNDSKTTIIFSNVTDKYYSQSSRKDLRMIADIDYITNNIVQSLLVKLFMLKVDGKRFSIKIRINEETREINESTIPELEHDEFTIYSDLTKEYYDFVLYYHFKNDGKNRKKIYYCAHNRIVKEEQGAIDISCELPGKESFDMLLCSKYLDERVNDSRDDFPSIASSKAPNWGVPLLYKHINDEMQERVHTILLNKFPTLEEINEQEIDKAIEENPHLAKYIKENNDIVKTSKSLTSSAERIFNKKKIESKDKFEKLLKDRSIQPEVFSQAVAEISEVAAVELGEYILYRENIIKALEDSVLDADKKEKFIHDIFMPQRTNAENIGDAVDYSMTNLWLLDDKFMTFSNAFSDVTIKSIIETIFKTESLVKDGIGMDLKKPDLVVFYNKEISRDALVIEFKGCNASLGEKEKAIAEIGRNCYLLKEKVKEINNIWAYIITNIDDEFEITLKASGYKERYTNSKDGKILYFYNDGIAHIYAIDVKAITADAFARNKTFLDILKNN